MPAQPTTTSATPAPEPKPAKIALYDPAGILRQAPDAIANMDAQIWQFRVEAAKAQERAARRKLELQADVARDPELSNADKRKAALEERLTTDQLYAKWTLRAQDLEGDIRHKEIDRDYWKALQANARILLLARVPDVAGGEA